MLSVVVMVGCVPIRPGGGYSGAVERDNRRVPAPQAFLPSVDGFAFVNSWPSQQAVELRTPFGLIAVGDAAAGLCGGMGVRGARLLARRRGSAHRANRPGKTPYIGTSFGASSSRGTSPAGVAQHYQWMNLPDGDTGFNAFGHHIIVERGLAWRTIGVQLPAVRADLEMGLPVPLGVVTAASTNPADLALNHQVLAYRYEVADDVVALWVYDPNRGQRDDVSLRFTVAEPTKPTAFDHDLGLDMPVRGFFRTAYTPIAPPRST